MGHDPVLVLATHSWVHTDGEYAIWTAAVITALGVMTRTRPARWVWRQLVSDPTSTWLGREVRGAVADEIGHEFVSNGGSSLRDLLDSLIQSQAVLGELATDEKDSRGMLAAKVDETRSAVVDMSAGISTTLSDHGGRITTLEGGHAAVLQAVKKLHECIDSRLPPASTEEREAS